MDSIVDRAAAVLARHPAPALPIAELTRILSDDVPGVALGSDDVLRTLAGSPDRFRVVRATSGRRFLLASMSAGVDEEGRAIVKPEEDDPLALLCGGPWIIGLEQDGAVVPRGSLAVLRASMTYLGQRLDEESACALARWVGLIWECRRVGEQWRRLGAGGIA